MKILFTGGGTGGHFYPIIAVIEEIERLVDERHLMKPELFYMAEDPYEDRVLFEHGVIFEKVSAGKLRRYFSVKNLTDFFKTIGGILRACWRMFVIFPDVVFSKGGYMSFPAVFAARLLRIPVIVHESDSVPGRANKWAGKGAYRIAVSFPETVSAFPPGKVAWTGQPLRRTISKKPTEESFSFLKLDKSVPVILVLGGSQGAELINDTLIASLPELVRHYQIIHQTGRGNFAEVERISKVAIGNSEFFSRYRPVDYLNDESMSYAAGVANLIVSRAGSTIFEIASWEIPSVIVPIADSNGDHQRQNAYNFARSGAAVVLEEANFNSHILNFEINRLFNEPGKLARMAVAAKSFFKAGGATKIAEEILSIGVAHER